VKLRRERPHALGLDVDDVRTCAPRRLTRGSLASRRTRRPEPTPASRVPIRRASGRCRSSVRCPGSREEKSPKPQPRSSTVPADGKYWLIVRSWRREEAIVAADRPVVVGLHDWASPHVALLGSRPKVEPKHHLLPVASGASAMLRTPRRIRLPVPTTAALAGHVTAALARRRPRGPGPRAGDGDQEWLGTPTFLRTGNFALSAIRNEPSQQ
jgi:hypothetical protein